MSRHEILHEDKGLAFGKDHVCGEFLMVWMRPNDENERKRQDEFGPDPDEVVVDEDRFTGLTQAKAKALIEEHGFTWQEMENEFLRHSREIEKDVARMIQDLDNTFRF